MSDTDERHRAKSVSEIIHNIKSCLQVVALGTDILREVREDEERFEDVCASIDHERREAGELLKELSALWPDVGATGDDVEGGPSTT